LTIDPSKENRLNHVIFVFGRLKRGVSLKQAQAEMDTISSRVGREFPEVRDWGIHVITLFDTFVSSELKTGLLVLSCAVACVLLSACANIAKSVAGSCGAAEEGNGGTRSVGRGPEPVGAPVAARKHGAFHCRRRGGAFGIGLGRAGNERRIATEPAAGARGAD
jgi:putative ABC transport system permease protein